MEGRRVAVVGTGWSGIARRSDRTVADMVIDATMRALEDAGLTLAHIDGVANSPTTASSKTDVSQARTDINEGEMLASVDGFANASLDFVASVLGLRRLRWFNAQIKGVCQDADRRRGRDLIRPRAEHLIQAMSYGSAQDPRRMPSHPRASPQPPVGPSALPQELTGAQPRFGVRRSRPETIR